VSVISPVLFGQLLVGFWWASGDGPAHVTSCLHTCATSF
jgi:hypothetical protein